MERKKATQSVDFRKIFCCPIRSERAVGRSGDACDVYQLRGIEVRCCRERSGAAFGPACYRKLIGPKSVGNRFQVSCPASKGAVPLGI